jgi:hypothetical protein
MSTGFGSTLGAASKRLFGTATEIGRDFGSTTGATFLVPIIVGVVAVVLIVMIVFIAIQMNTTKPKKFLRGPVDLYTPKSPVVIDRSAANSQMKGSYTLGFYLRVDAVPDMRAAATPLFTWPGVWNMDYNAAQEQLVWTFQQTPDEPLTAPQPDQVVLPGVPLQRWTQVVMVFEGRTVDLYVNGALIKSDTLSNMPPSASASITIVPGGIMGQLAYVQLWGRRLSSSDIGSNYTDTSDSQGRPFLGPAFFNALKGISLPNLFCPSGNCGQGAPAANASQTWEFPYA